jgi:putative intracellular protease/amidase
MKIQYYVMLLLIAVFASVSMLIQADTKGQKETQRILIVLTSHDQIGDSGKATGYYLSEVSHPVKEFMAAGYQIDFVSPKGGEPPVDPTSYDLNDAVNARFIADRALQQRIKSTLYPSQVDPTLYSAILFSGGHGTMWDFPDNHNLNRITRDIYESGGVVAAVCHGPSALVEVTLSNGTHLIHGKSLTAFTNEEEADVKLTSIVPFSLEDRLKRNGANFMGAAKFSKNVVVYDRLVTGQNPASARGVAREVIRILSP